MITEVKDDDTVSLCIFNPSGLFFAKDAKRSDAAQPGCWSWPEIPRETQQG